MDIQIKPPSSRAARKLLLFMFQVVDGIIMLGTWIVVVAVMGAVVCFFVFALGQLPQGGPAIDHLQHQFWTLGHEIVLLAKATC